MKVKKPIRLYWRENYSEKPPVVKRAIRKAVDKSVNEICLYPGDLYDEVVKLIAGEFKLGEDQVILGHGVEGLIHLISQTFLDKEKVGGIFEPSFFVFNNNLKRCKSIESPCHYDKKIDFDDFFKRIKDTDLFFLASPNTETANYLLDKKQIEKFVKNYKGILVVDECYYGIGDITVADLLKKYDKLIVLRSITKTMGMGGLRLGFALANKQIIKKMNFHFREIELDPMNSFSLNIFKETFQYYDLLVREAKDFKEEFLELVKSKFPRDKFHKNDTNFIFMDISKYKIPAFKILNFMSKNGYLYSEEPMRDNSKLYFPELIEITPPPREFWENFVEVLQTAFAETS